MTTDRNSEGACEAFTTWFCLNYPGPHTIISDPTWHAPRVFRQAEWAIRNNPTPPASIPAAEVQALVERWRAVDVDGWRVDEAFSCCADELAKLIPRNPE